MSLGEDRALSAIHTPATFAIWLALLRDTCLALSISETPPSKLDENLIPEAYKMQNRQCPFTSEKTINLFNFEKKKLLTPRNTDRRLSGTVHVMHNAEKKSRIFRGGYVFYNSLLTM